VLLIVVAVFIAVEVKDLLIGQSVEPKYLAEIKQFLAERTEILEVYNVLTMQFGPDAMVAIKARMVPTGSEQAMIAAINKVELELRSEFEMISWLFFEPDVKD